MLEMRKNIQFEVQGSAKEPYTVLFLKSGNNLSAYCTCPAGQNGMYCKHRFGILKGSTKGIVSDNADQVEIVASWLAGSDVEAAMQNVKQAEDVVAAAKTKLTKAKQALAATMRD
jgi:uncharacterized Zn finger protein